MRVNDVTQAARRVLNARTISNALVKVLGVLRVFEPVERTAVRWTGYSLRSWASTQREGIPYLPSLLLTTIGRTTGELRSNVLFYFKDGDDYVVVASSAGSPQHPQWYRNLQEQPQGWVRVGRHDVPVRSETLNEADKQRLWPRLVGGWPRYADHERRAAPRRVPVVRLRPIR